MNVTMKTSICLSCTVKTKLEDLKHEWQATKLLFLLGYASWNIIRDRFSEMLNLESKKLTKYKLFIPGHTISIASKKFIFTVS